MRQDLDQRIEKVENLLNELKQEKQKREEGMPPTKNAPMKDHIMDLAKRVGLEKQDVIIRTRETSEGSKKMPSGFNKEGIVKINEKLHELEAEADKET